MSVRAIRGLLGLFLAFTFLTGGGCSKDEKLAEKLLERGKRLEKARQYTQALEVYDQLKKKYPQSHAAKTVENSVDFKFIEEAIKIDRMKNVNEVKEHLKLLAKAVETYYFAENAYPPNVDVLVPTYIPALPRDPWGARYTYGLVDGDNKIVPAGSPVVDGYIIAWFGKDRIPGGEGDDSDVFVRKGQFVQF